MAKTLGLIGGTGPESTIEYYRLLIAKYRELADGNSPSLIINSVNIKPLLEWMTAGELGKVTDYLCAEFEKLHRAGADFAALTANTPHIVFDELQQRSALPLISGVEATRDRVQELGLKTVALFGTRFTMQAPFYREVFGSVGITVVVPEEDEQSWIHEKYMGELVNAVFLPETRDRLLAIAGRMKHEDAIDGLILGGTELPLILGDTGSTGMPFLDTTRIHVERAVERMITASTR